MENLLGCCPLGCMQPPRGAVPCVAGNDVICPPETAYALHEAWPELRLRVVPGGGHSMYDPGLQWEVLEAVDSFRAMSLTDH